MIYVQGPINQTCGYVIVWVTLDSYKNCRQQWQLEDLQPTSRTYKKPNIDKKLAKEQASTVSDNAQGWVDKIQVKKN